MDNNVLIERRLCPRFPVTIGLSCFDAYSEKKVYGKTKDISAQGHGSRPHAAYVGMMSPVGNIEQELARPLTEDRGYQRNIG